MYGNLLIFPLPSLRPSRLTCKAVDKDLKTFELRSPKWEISSSEIKRVLTFISEQSNTSESSAQRAHAGVWTKRVKPVVGLEKIVNFDEI